MNQPLKADVVVITNGAERYVYMANDRISNVTMTQTTLHSSMVFCDELSILMLDGGYKIFCIDRESQQSKIDTYYAKDITKVEVESHYEPRDQQNSEGTENGEGKAEDVPSDSSSGEK